MFFILFNFNNFHQSHLQIPIYFIIAKSRPKRNRSRPTPGGCVPFIRSMLVSLLPLQFCQLRFHLCDQHLQLLLTFLACVRIHIPSVLFTVDPRRGVTAFKQVVIDLRDASGSRLSPLPHIRLEVHNAFLFRLRFFPQRRLAYASVDTGGGSRCISLVMWV